MTTRRLPDGRLVLPDGSIVTQAQYDKWLRRHMDETLTDGRRKNSKYTRRKGH